MSDNLTPRERRDDRSWGMMQEDYDTDRANDVPTATDRRRYNYEETQDSERRAGGMKTEDWGEFGEKLLDRYNKRVEDRKKMREHNQKFREAFEDARRRNTRVRYVGVFYRKNLYFF